MKLNNKKVGCVLAILFSLLYLPTTAQDFLKGKIEKDGALIQEIFYDRTQNLITKNVYQTIYKVMDKRKKSLYTITLTHDRAKRLLFVSAKKQTDTNAAGSTVKYNALESGLIFSNQNNVDTSFSIEQPYQYLLSFTDTARDYPILHKLKLGNENDLLLDPLTKLRLKRHREVVLSLLKKNPMLIRKLLSSNQEQLFEEKLRNLCDSFYTRFRFFEVTVSTIQAEIEAQTANLFVTKKVYGDARRYEGQRNKSIAEGTGLFMANGNYYSGIFSKGKFVSGNVMLRNDAFEYCGNYSQDSLNGIGTLRYKGGNYVSGSFIKGELEYGVTFSHDKETEGTFLGDLVNGERTGYGEFKHVKGALFYGEFQKGRFINGYSREVDPFGFYTYSKIQDGVKMTTDAPLAEDFFNYIEVKKAQSSQ